MALYTEAEEEGFERLVTRHAWVETVLEAEYGERETNDETIPESLNWLLLVPEDPRYDFDAVEPSLAFEDETTGYACTLWDASGENDYPWAVLLADDYGVRLLSEYSVLEEDADEKSLDSVLQRATDELPDRLLRGDFTRIGDTIPIPDFLTN